MQTTENSYFKHPFYVAGLLLFLGIWHISCQSTSNYKDSQPFTIADIATADSLTAEPVTVDSVASPADIDFIGDYMLVLDMYQDTMLQIFKPNGEKLSARVPRGEGPGELPFAGKFKLYKAQQKLLMYEHNINKILVFEYTTDQNQLHFHLTQEINILDQGVDNFSLTTNNRFIGRAFGDNRYNYSNTDLSMDNKRLLVYDSTGMLIQTWGKYPEYDHNFNYFERPKIFRSTLVSSPDDLTRTALAYRYTDLFEVYQGNQLIARMHGPDQFFPNFVKDPGHFPNPVSTCGNAFFDAFATQEGVYTLYASKKATQLYDHRVFTRVILFTWDGTPAKLYYLNKPMMRIAVHKGYIYGIDDLLTLWRFKLN